MAVASPPSQASPPPPFRVQRYGRYVLVERLGVGGMAEVFRAVVVGPERFQRVVVVKRVLPHLTENATFLKMFVDEATLCGRLSHPNIIQVHEFGKQEGSYFIAMEHVEGRNLSNVLTRLGQRGAQIPPTVAADIARQACLGLAYAHTLTGSDGKPLGIIHRDVTPSNVMIGYAGVVKLLDFGIARVADEARTHITDAGQVKGKSAYLAPEQLRSGTLDGRVDVWAMGIVLHEALTARRLFKGTNPLQAMKLIQEMEIPPPSKINPKVPVRLDHIVMRALQRKREDRCTAAEMAEALESFLIEQRYSSQEVPRFMRVHFAEEIEKGSALPHDEIRKLLSDGSVDSPPPASKELPRSEAATVENVDLGDLGEMDDAGGGDEVSEALRAQRRRRLLIGGGGGGAILLVTLMAWLMRSEPRATTPAPAPESAAESSAPAAEPAAAPSPPPPAQPSPAPVPRPPPPVVAPPAAPAVVKIAISSQPTDAEVFSEARRETLGRTPLTVTLPRGTKTVELRITKEGHVPGVLRVVPDADKPALVTLAREAPPNPANDVSRPSRRTRRKPEGKVRNAIPVDPFAR